MSVPTFVVGTGRCGSTMLSNMLREHPKVLSLSEFFGYVAEGQLSASFRTSIVDGQGFWATVSNISPWARFCSQHRITIPESLYPRDDPESRFSWQTGVPAILMTTLPHLTGDHDRLFDLLGGEVKKWPTATVGEHYRHLFRWLAEHFEKPLWVERSGTSLLWVDQLLATFPEARFIHVVRDGRDAASSMREHSGLRLVVGMSRLKECLGVDPFESADRTHLDRVPAELRSLLPESFDPDAHRAFEVPLPLCGEFWAQQIDAGLKVLREVPEGRLLTLRYEDFFVDPKRQLNKLAVFLGDEFIDEDWSTRCAATVRKPRSTWRDLAEADARALTAACEPGFEMLRAVGVQYEV